VNTTLAAGIPNPISLVTDTASEAAQRAAAPILHSAGMALLGWVADACRDVGRELVAALSGPATVGFTEGWWASTRSRELAAVVAAIAVSLAVAFLLLAVIQGLLAGDPLGMLRTALGHVPLSALGMAAVVGVTEMLLRVTDEATALVLRGTPESLGRFVDGFALNASVMTGGFAAVLLLLIFLVGALLVWAELVVRSALVYLLVAFAPLALAARIWPAARGVFRRLCELGLALIFSKFAIGLALALGSVALAGGGPGTDGPSGTSLSLGGLLGGATLMGMAAFTPFVVLKLIPVVEAAVVAHGVSRSPVRGAQTAAQVGSSSARVARLAAGRGSVGAATAVGAASASRIASPGPAVRPAAPPARRHGTGRGPGPGRPPSLPSPAGGDGRPPDTRTRRGAKP